MPRKHWPSEFSRPITLGVFVIMIIAAIVLYVLQHTSYGLQILNKQTEMPDLNTVLDSVLPQEDEIQQAFQPRLDNEQLKSKDIGIITRDGQVLRARVSKPEGPGPFPVVAIIHDGPSSTRTTDQVAALWGEALSQEHQMVTITPDWREGQMGQEEVTDILGALDWMGKLRETKDQPITLFGMDHGVYIALSVVEAQRESITGLIAAYGYSDIAAEYHFLAEHDTRGAENFLDTTGCSDQTAVELCLKELSNTAVHLTIPTLVIHSQSDSVVPLSQSEQIASQVTDQTLLTTDYITDTNIDHFFLSKDTNVGFADAKTIIDTWLTTHL